MNIEEYINERLADVKYYLRGINYNKFDSEKAVEGLREDVSKCFNDEPLYRRETDKLVRDIKGMYDTLKDHELEFATSKAEVDNAVLQFEAKLKQRIVEFKNDILSLFKVAYDYQYIMLDNSLDEVNVRVRNRKDKKTMEEMHEMKELFGLRECFIIIYIFMTYITNKSNKLEELKNRIAENFTPRTQEYLDALAEYVGLKSEKNYDKFIELYEEKTNKLFSKTPRARG